MSLSSLNDTFLPSERAGSRGSSGGFRPDKKTPFRFRLEPLGLLTSYLAIGAAAWFLWPLGSLIALAVGTLSWVISWTRSQAKGIPSGSRPVPYEEASALHGIADGLAARAGLSATPEFYLLPSPVPDAAAVGDASAPRIVVTVGLLNGLGSRGIEAILAHEVAHIEHGDLFWLNAVDATSSLVSSIGRTSLILGLIALPFGFISGAGFLAALAAPVAAALLSWLLRAVSRRREFEADAEAARLCGDGGEALSATLEEVERQGQSPYLSLMGGLMGFSPWRNGGVRPSSSHPSLRERLERLRPRG